MTAHKFTTRVKKNMNDSCSTYACVTNRSVKLKRKRFFKNFRPTAEYLLDFLLNKLILKYLADFKKYFDHLLFYRIKKGRKLIIF